MRIGIDARELCGHATGAGRYLHGILREWAAHPLPHQFLLYAPEAIDLPLDAERFARRVIRGPSGTWWEQVRLPRAVAVDRLDAFFSPAYTAPLRWNVPVVLAIHDVSFAAHPEWYRMREGFRRRTITRMAARRASAVVTISAFSKSEIERYLGLPASRIHVIPPGITRPAVSSAALVASAVREPRVLFVGSIFNRRHVPDLIRAVAHLARRHPGVSLDIVGDNRSQPREDVEMVASAERASAFVRWRRYVTDSELADLYARAGAFAFLSEYEGLGLTPLEALAAGVPPVVLDTPVARESCGEAAAYVHSPDARIVADMLERVLVDQSLRARLLSAAPHVLSTYDWRQAAADTLALLEHT
jgi:glycosyltransferase involved in cell wall biosynthesis